MELSILLAYLAEQYTCKGTVILRIDLDKHDDGITLCVVSSHVDDTPGNWVETYFEYSNEGDWTYIECSIHTADPIEVA